MGVDKHLHGIECQLAMFTQNNQWLRLLALCALFLYLIMRHDGFGMPNNIAWDFTQKILFP